VHTLKHTDSINALAYHPKDPYLLGGTNSGIALWNTTNGDLVRVISDHSKVRSFAWLRAHVFACGEYKGELHVYASVLVVF
jgi:WD40 repeat protein